MKRYTFSLRGRRPLDKPFLFKGAGLPNVYLRSGVKIEKDPDYGELVTIEKMPELFLAIAFAIVAKAEPLTGDEMRFLRKRMELRPADLAQELRVTEQTVANYEKGKTEAGPADLALRYLYLAHVAEDEEIADDLRERARDLMLPSRRAARRTAGAWQEARV
jgi:DNA-binding transcriptional regulator YiaG